jgi:diguanylate cyclase (GGDEF)-like protein/PAS domain S-box-containing protein
MEKVTVSRDITVNKESSNQLHEILWRVIDSMPQAIFWQDLGGIYLGCNPLFVQMMGLNSSDEIVGKTKTSLLAYKQVNQALLKVVDRDTVNGDQFYHHTVECLKLKKNVYCWLEISRTPLKDSQGQLCGVVCTFEDITLRKKSEDKFKKIARALENCTEAIFITDERNRIVLVNRAFTQITGYTEIEVLGKSPSNVIRSGKHTPDFYKEMWSSVNAVGHWEGEVWNRRKNGDVFPEWLHITVIKDEVEQKITHYLAIFSDITHRKQADQHLTYLAYYDSLTGLPNRALFDERVTRAIQHAQRHQSLIAVMFLDLDRFKYVNDTWGHAIGDLLLKAVAKRLLDTIQKTDTVARLGGDDFTIALEDVNSTEEVALVAQKILDVMVTSFNLNGQETFITLSIGISLYPNDGTDADTLLKNADVAMYRAKEGGKNNYQFFTTKMNTLVHQRLLLETQLRYALEREEFILYYQPQMHLASGHIVGAEVLLRWQHPELGLVPPQVFIPLAEETGLVVAIGEWVLYQTCLQHQHWCNSGKPILRMAVNLSLRQFQQDHLIKQITRILAETHMDPTLLELELTESILMQDVDKTIKTLHTIKEFGIQLAIDDFGTGYSSLNYLKRFPIDVLKIDKSFVHDIPTSQDDMAITRAIIALARSLRLSVIAEGVENKSQLIFLKSLKCDEVQGYLIAPPLPEQEFLELLE